MRSERSILALEGMPVSVAGGVRKAVGGFLRYVEFRDQHVEPEPNRSLDAYVRYVAHRDRTSPGGRIFGRDGRHYVADAHGESPLKHSHEASAKSITVSPDMKSLATSDSHGFIWLWDIASREPLTVLRLLPDGRPLAINAEGHYRSDEDVTDAIVYVVQTADGQQTLTPAEFAAKYGWQNDPTQVKLQP